MDDKTKSIVAHLHLIGWVIALVMNQSDKGLNTSFYLRQTLGIMIFSILIILPLGLFSYVIWILVAIMWIVSLIGSLSGEQKPLPVVGDMFQQWFKGIS